MNNSNVLLKKVFFALSILLIFAAIQAIFITSFVSTSEGKELKQTTVLTATNIASGDLPSESSTMDFARFLNSNDGDGLVLCAEYTQGGAAGADSIAFTVDIGNYWSTADTTGSILASPAITVAGTTTDGHAFYELPAADLNHLFNPRVVVTPTGVSSDDSMNVTIYILHKKFK